MGFAELRYEAIRTPLERPLIGLRRFLGFPQRLRHPELRDIYLEDSRISRLLPSLVAGQHCIDIGCHYGSTLSRMIKLSPRGSHVAFEPAPGKVAFLRRKFSDVDVREIALSDRAGRVTFYMQERTGFSGLVDNNGSGQRIEVTCARLDDVVPRDRRFGFVKLDTEGAELPILRGAVQFLARDRPALLFECGPGGPEAFDYRPSDLHAFLTAQGYAVQHLDGRVVSAEQMDAAHVYPFAGFNWIAVPCDP